MNVIKAICSAFVPVRAMKIGRKAASIIMMVSAHNSNEYEHGAAVVVRWPSRPGGVSATAHKDHQITYAHDFSAHLHRSDPAQVQRC